MKNQIIKNLASNYLLTGIGMVLAFFLVPFLIRKLGHEGYGIVVVAESQILFFSIFTSAVRISMSRFATLSLSQKKAEDCLLYLATGKRILNIFMAGSFLVGIVIAIYFPVFFRVPEGLHQQSQMMFMLIILAFVLSIPNVVYWAILYGYQRFDLINFSNAGGTIFRAIAIFCLYSFLSGHWASLGTYGIIYFLTAMGQNYIVYLWALSMMPAARKIKLEYDRPKATEIISYARYTVMGTVSGVLYESVMPSIINIFCGPVANTIYSVASRIPSLLRNIFLQPAWSLIPTCTHFVAQNEHHKVEKLFFLYSKGMMAVFCPMIFSVAVCSRMILHLWVGDSFGPAIVVMVLLAANALVGSYTYLCSVVLNAYGQIKIPTIVGIITAVLSIGLGVLLAFYFKMGLPGMAIGVLIATLAGSFFFSPIYTCHILKTDVKKYLMASFFIPMFFTMISFGWEFLFQADPRFSMKFFGLAAVASALYVWLAFRCIFNEDEKTEILSILKIGFGKLCPR